MTVATNSTLWIGCKVDHRACVTDHVEEGGCVETDCQARLHAFTPDVPCEVVKGKDKASEK